jgi:septal ring factor EnvC (AmiA/AmiB activator)
MMDFETWEEFNDNTSEGFVSGFKGMFTKDSVNQVMIVVVGGLITGILTKLLDIHFQKKDLRRRLESRRNVEDLQSKLDLLDKNEDELKSELKVAEDKVKKIKNAISSIKNTDIKSHLNKELERHTEHVTIIKSQLDL